jgi:N-methylhydantoinase B
MSIVREMEVINYRAARSPVVFSGHDLSSAILDRDGQLVACITGLAVHILPMVFQARNLLERYRDSMREGDMFIGNDPWEGSVHLNDVAVFVPVLYEGDLVALTCIRVHWPDIGGMVPGSVSGNAREIYQEGLRIPLMRLGARGTVDAEILRLLMINVRVPEEREGDLIASLNACQAGAVRLIELMRRYGKETILEIWDEILRVSERRMSGIISQLPESTLVHEGYLDNDGTTQDLLRIRATVTIRNGRILVDFTGSARQSDGPINVTLALAHCFVFMAVKAALDPKGPINSGSFRLMDVIAPEGTLLNARPPAACAGTGEVRYANNIALMALSRIVPERVLADDGSSTVHHPLYLKDDAHSEGRQVVHYDLVGGGGGARADRDGLDFVRHIGSGNSNTPSIEVLEHRYPQLFTRHTFRQDSGGPGKFRGGLGIVRERRLLVDGVLSVLGDHSIAPLAGLEFGFPGALAKWEIVRDGKADPVSAEFGLKVSNLPVRAGDMLRSGTNGGSGWGDPLERDPARVLDDVIDEKVSLEQAREIYGVAIERAHAGVDLASTSELRHKIKHGVMLKAHSAPAVQFDGGARVAWVSSNHKGEVDARKWRLAEVFRPGTRNPLRLRMHVDPALPADAVMLDEEAMRDWSIAKGELVLWRMIGN